MGVTLHRAVKNVRWHVGRLDEDRAKAGKPVPYPIDKHGIKDALLPLHEEWQGLMLCVRSGTKSVPQAAAQALRLAAAAMKFGMDLADEQTLDAFEHHLALRKQW
jgi:hypothetical protein